MRRPTPDALAAAAIVGAVTLVLAELLSPSRALYFRDLLVFFQPMKSFLADSVRAGELPWWNPHILAGSPFMANLQSGVFYPPNLIFHVLPQPIALNLFVVGHVAMGGLGMYALHRGWGRRPLVACFPGIVYACGGVTLSAINLLNNMQTLTWTPWVLLAWLRFAREARPRDLVVTALLFVLQFLAGAPVALVVTAALAFIYGWLERRQPARWVYAAGFAWAGLLALTLSAFQLLPTLQLIGASTRHHVTSGTEWSMHPGSLLGLLLPRLYVPDEGLGAVLTPSFETGVPWLLGLYVGPFVLAMVLLALVSRPASPEIRVGIGLLIGFTLLSLGEHLPPLATLFKLELFRSGFRVPEKFIFGAFVVLVLLAARGFDELIERPRRSWIQPAVVGVPVLIVLAWLGRQAATADGFGRLLAGGLACAAAYGIYFLLRFRPDARPQLLGAMLLAAVVLDLRLVNGPLNPTVEAGVAEAGSPAAEYLSNEGAPFRIQTGIRIIGDGATYGVPDDMPPLPQAALYRGGLAPNLNVPAGLSSFYGFEPMMPFKAAFFLNRMETATDLEQKARLLALTNVRYLLSRQPIDSPAFDDVAAWPDWRLYEVRDWLPRAFTRGRLREVGFDDFPREMFDGGLDSRRTILAPGREPGERVLSQLDSPGRASVVSYGAQRVELEARMDEPGWVVLLDADYPGWRARIDDRPEPILPAYGMFRAVEVEAGDHRIVFEYRETRFARGLAVSLIGLLLCAATLGWGSARS